MFGYTILGFGAGSAGAGTVIVEYLLLGAGGGGGGHHGGGGGGGYRLGSTTLSTETSGGTHVSAGTRETPMELETGTEYNITLGAAGTANQVQASHAGGDTTFVVSGTETRTAYGGGGGSDGNLQQQASGTGIGGGGGGSSGHPTGISTDNPDQAFGGGNYGSPQGGGGGGSGAAGSGKDGGAGLYSSITGTQVGRGGGGGGAAGGEGATAFGGGDADAAWSADNRGGGGGGGHNYSSVAGKTGVIIIKIPNTHTATFPSGSVTSATTTPTGYKVYNITAADATATIQFD